MVSLQGLNSKDSDFFFNKSQQISVTEQEFHHSGDMSSQVHDIRVSNVEPHLHLENPFVLFIFGR